MGQLFTALVIVAAIVWILRVRATKRDGVESRGFSMAFQEGRATSVRGRVPRAVHDALLDVAAHAGITGEIREDADGHLAFSPSIPEPVRQRLRNVHLLGQPR